MYLDNILALVRVLIYDLEDEPTYSDERLQQVIMVAAYYVSSEVNWANDYIVDVSGEEISPDPTDDSDFINMVALKAACLMDQGLYRTKAMLAGVRAKCGPAELETNNLLKGFMDLLSAGPCKAYEEFKFQYSFGRTDHLKAVLSPFVNRNFDPTNLRGYDNGQRHS